MGLPSTYTSPLAIFGDIPNHMETGREPLISSHITGSHKALEVCVSGSLSIQKRPTIPTAYIKVAMNGGICKAVPTSQWLWFRPGGLDPRGSLQRTGS